MTLLRVTRRPWCSQNSESVAAFFAERGSISVNNGPPAVGRAAIAEEARGFMRTFPDMIVTMDEVTRESELGGRSSCDAVFHWTLTGTNTGPGGTGKRLRISGYELWKIDNGAGGSRATWTGKPDRVGEPGGRANQRRTHRAIRGHFDSAEYQCQLKHGVD